MIEIQIGDCAAHEGSVGQTRKLVCRRQGSKGAGLSHRLMNGLSAEVGRTCAAFSLVPIDRDTNAPIVGVFETLYFAESCRRRQSEIVTDSNLCLVDALRNRFCQGLLDDSGQLRRC